MVWSFAPRAMSTPLPSSAADTPDIVGQMAGEYRLRRKLGEGGYGAVYEAEHPVLKRKAAVKVLHRAAGADSDGVRRFISEAQAATQIRSRHIVDIFSFGTLPDGRRFYVMDLLEGEPLDRFIAREKRLDVPSALQLLRPLADALDAAHAADIVHRDLKPQNIFLVWEPSGETVPKLLDFGTAKLLGHSPVHTMSGTVIGTPLYMSPEQALGQQVDARADIYALGLLCHELLTGAPPITGASAIAVLAAHLAQRPARASEASSSIAAELDAPILHMLEKDPNQRPTRAGEAIAELVRAAERAGHVIPPGMPHLSRPPVAAHQPLESSPGQLAEGRWSVSRSSERGMQRDTFGDGAGRTPTKSRKTWALAAVAIVGAGVTYLAATDQAPATNDDRRAVTPAAAASGQAMELAGLDAAAVPRQVPAPPGSVEVTVQGAPRGARVLIDGKPMGDTSAPVTLPFGDETVQLTIAAAGYESAQLFVVPNQASTATVTLRKRAAAPAASRPHIPSDLENPF